MSQRNREVVQQAWRAFAGRDAGRIATVFTEDAEWLAPVGNATAVALSCPSHLIGRTAIARFLSIDFRRLFTDVSIDFRGFHADGDTVFLEETMTATLSTGNGYLDTARGHRMIFGEGT